MHLRRTRFHAYGLMLIVIWAVGCAGGSGNLNPVKGKVLYKGQPLAGALVTLHPRGDNSLHVERPTGFTREDGTFVIVTGQKTGAAAGEYVVTIICSQPAASSDKGKKKGAMSFDMGNRDDVDRLGGAYANMAASKLTVTIKNGSNDLEPFNLK